MSDFAWQGGGEDAKKVDKKTLILLGPAQSSK
jgi:hypothetical protein